MTYKVCQAIFSTNRIPYLRRTLLSQTLLDPSGCKVTKVFFDDYPKDRNDLELEKLVRLHGYKHVILHKENQGITKTWQELFDFVNAGDFDYVWHQEDDTQVLYHTKFIDLIKILEENPNLSQVQLRRDNWYSHETEPIGPKPDDQIWNKYRIERNNPYFWMMSCMYPAWIARKYNRKEMNSFPNEASLAKFMLEKYNSAVGLLKTSKGEIMINHFGEYSRGTRTLKGDLGWEKFDGTDPNIDYNSKDGSIYHHK